MYSLSGTREYSDPNCIFIGIRKNPQKKWEKIQYLHRVNSLSNIKRKEAVNSNKKLIGIGILQ